MNQPKPQIYIVVISDRHADDELEPFREKADALIRAQRATEEMRSHYRVDESELDTELTEAMERAGWLYYASLEDAGSVHVEARELK